MKASVICLLCLGLALGLAACARGPAIPPTTLLRLTPERPATASPPPTAAAWPTLTPHIYCPGALESNLIVGERGRVTLTDDGKRLNLRAGPGTDFNIIAQMAPLEDFLVLAGARCGGSYVWYEVEYRGILGWIAEGGDGQYFAEPWLPG